MMSAKLATLGLIKLKVTWNKDNLTFQVKRSKHERMTCCFQLLLQYYVAFHDMKMYLKIYFEKLIFTIKERGTFF